MQNNRANRIICNWCGNITELVWVHGHGQCKICRTNIEECCRGENCNSLYENDSGTKLSQKRIEENN